MVRRPTAAARKPAPVRAPIAAPAVAKPPEVEIFDDIEQGSPDWYALRLGVPTASNFSIMMRDGDAKTRQQLQYKLAGEILTGRPAEGKIQTAAMMRGTEMEAEARAHYIQSNFEDVEQVGFMRRKLPSGRWVGASPDGLREKRTKALEIKTMAPHLMIERLVNGAGLPPEHRAQVQGTMWIGNLVECDLQLFYSGMPVAPKFTVKRDNTYIAELDKAVQVFEYETRMLVEKIRKMGS